MKIPQFARYTAFQRCKNFCIAGLVSIVVASFGHAAQRNNQPERTPRESKEPEAIAEQQGPLTVDVVLVEAGKERRPLSGATVHIVGGDDPRETNDKGRVRFPKVPSGPVSFNVIIPNVATCKFSDITASEVLVEVENSQKGKCTLGKR